MYNVKVPLHLNVFAAYDRNIILENLKALDAETVFLCPPDGEDFWNSYDTNISLLNEAVEFLHSNGFIAGVWVWAFQYRNDGSFVYMKNPDGKDSKSSVCPADPKWHEKMGCFVEDAAGTGIDVFMFDDDFRYGFIDNGFACCCDNHRKLMQTYLGEYPSMENLKRNILCGGKNRYRSAFLKANGEALKDFSADMRRRLDKINPECRMGFCACITSWDIDGVHPDVLSEILAGKTKPFYRLIGAPYWANVRNWGNRLADVIELERAEASFRRNRDIEIFSEGDTFPRPRFKVPAAFLEGFDTALRAAGCTDGILKYALDYASSPSYETGFVSAHVRNKETYKQIDKLFSGKRSSGIRVAQKPDRFSELQIPEEFENSTDIQNIAFPAEARMLAACSLPAVYDCSIGPVAAFGENVKVLTEDDFRQGVITDIDGAHILSDRGTDTGIVSFGEKTSAGYEFFSAYGERVNSGGCKFIKTELAEGVSTLSFFETAKEKYPASFCYENKAGQKFFVLTACGYFNSEELFRQYTRARQLAEVCESFFGFPVSAVCPGHPDLYIQSKEGNGRMSAGLWNFFPDEIEAPVITLSHKIKAITGTINCDADYSGRTVRLSKLPAYGFAAFEAELIL